MSLRNDSLHYAVTGNHGATRVYMQPASDGTGVIAGGGMRAVLECAGRAQRARQELRLAQPDQRGARHHQRAGEVRSPDDIAAKRGKSSKRSRADGQAEQSKIEECTLVKSLHGQLANIAPRRAAWGCGASTRASRSADTPENRGMINAAVHLLQVEEYGRMPRSD